MRYRDLTRTSQWTRGDTLWKSLGEMDRIRYEIERNVRSSRVVTAARRIKSALRPGPTLVGFVEAVFSRGAVLFLAFLGVFILHQMFLWLSIRPAVAFERAKDVIYVTEVVWDSFSNIGNAALDVGDTLIPLWNAGANVRLAFLTREPTGPSNLILTVCVCVVHAHSTWWSLASTLRWTFFLCFSRAGRTGV